jgi:hypothetical protein
MSETVSVPAGDWELAQRAHNLLNNLLTNPGTAPSVEDAIAKVNPNAKFPGREAREAQYAPVRSEIETERAERLALQKRLDDRDAKEAADREKNAEDTLLARMSSIKSKRGFSDEMMDKVVSRMREQNNPDIDAAAAWVSESLPKPGPVVGHDFLPSTVETYGSETSDKKWEGLEKNPQQWMDNDIRKIVRDPRFINNDTEFLNQWQR